MIATSVVTPSLFLFNILRRLVSLLWTRWRFCHVPELTPVLHHHAPPLPQTK
ncbi:hypothetical protein F2Q69_00031830 [Brassica cretica]|uniref:Uncharacterized protein n=1 Tax=Brassica cretica TaxID=69181 RepID=A0A8S9S823_BRACR|nr:hypothetical protein F2Q69_00031830 [Brassica cretica]